MCFIKRKLAFCCMTILWYIFLAPTSSTTFLSSKFSSPLCKLRENCSCHMTKTLMHGDKWGPQLTKEDQEELAQLPHLAVLRVNIKQNHCNFKIFQILYGRAFFFFSLTPSSYSSSCSCESPANVICMFLPCE